MRFIISPAKTMNAPDTMGWRDLPQFLDRTRLLARELHAKSYEELRELWACSDALARANYERLQLTAEGSGWDTGASAQLTPAILAYEGLQYQSMAPQVMTEGQLEWLQEHLRIVSGFYGLVRPFDAVVPYRLEMQAKLACGGARNLYEFWGRSLYDALADECGAIVNVASVEYGKAVEPWARNGKARMLTCLFGQVNDEGKFVQRSTYAKMARGTFVRWCAERGVESPEELRSFDVGFELDEGRSSEDTVVFVGV